MIYDVVIIGSGPAGLTAAIYGERAKLKTLILEKQPMSGGQILNTYEVDNYPGLPGMGGFELGMKLREHADAMGAEFKESEVEKINIKENEIKEVITAEGVFETKTVIFATGASHRKLNIPGEKEYTGVGVSYCATCDGAFFKGKETVIVGGGDVALEDALFLSRACSKVYLVHRRDELRGAKSLQERVMQTENIEIIWNSIVTSINGNEHVTNVDLHDKEKDTNRTLNIDGVFIAVGIVPNSEKAQGVVELDKQGYIIAGEETKTSVNGFFAAGDVRTKPLRQVITAAADGANAITSVEKYLYKL